MKYKLGIDVGGTFTDFILISDSGETSVHKTLSTPKDPSIGVVRGIRDLAKTLDMSPPNFARSIKTIVHGTTVATNALLTLNGAKTALITTHGIRDALEMRRGIREEQYNNHYRNVTPLIPRYLRFTVAERIDASDTVLQSLNESELNGIAEKILEEQVESVAVCLLNSYMNTDHEDKVTEYLRRRFPDCFITASTEVLPSIRFYERISTTAVNAYIGPVVAKYLENLLNKLDGIEFTGSLLIMQSNGGVVAPEIVKRSPAVTVLSGPAAAPAAGSYYAELLGYKDCITIDMGGTSFDASLVIDGQCVTSTEGSINRYRIALPTLDIVTIGAGGGSIGWIDEGGLLQMGPQSAGALPGPICYDLGGELPACTDANLVLGYLSPDYFAGGEIKLNLEKTRRIMEENTAVKLGLSLKDTAVGMYRIINNNMAQGVREVSIERGYDPREFLFIVAGGAGPIHAGEICKELEIPMFVVPNVSSIFCAAGMLMGDLKHDYIRSYITSLSQLDETHFAKLFAEMKTTGVETLKEEGIEEDKIEIHPVLDLRYAGQYHEVQLAVSWDDVTKLNFDSMLEKFHAEHNRLFGYSLEEGTDIELINVRLRVIGIAEKPKFLAESGTAVSLDDALKHSRMVYIPETGNMQNIPVYNGDLPLHGNLILGPAIIEKVTTTIFVSADYDCKVDEYGSFIVYNKEKFPGGYGK